MIVSVSTVKDSAANVELFVRRNLGRGIDHMVVFTEDTGAEAEQVLDAHPGVTHVRTGDGWWPERPNDLNDRQRLNANLARVLLAPFEWAQWLVHIDADEVVVLDPQVVAAFPPQRDTFRMKPWEAVSRDAWPDGKVTHFKRLLPRPELILLQTLGVIDKPNNKTYFHGHVRGKVGVRVRSDLRLGIHRASDARGSVVSRPVKGFAVLHYDAATPDEFDRKFTTLARSGSDACYRLDKIPVVKALSTLTTLDLADDVRRGFMRTIYDRTTREDFETLHGLGLLVEVDGDVVTHQATAPPADDLEALRALLAAAAPMSRDSLQTGHPSGGWDVLAAVLAATGHPAGPAAEIVLRSLAVAVEDAGEVEVEEGRGRGSGSSPAGVRTTPGPAAPGDRRPGRQPGRRPGPKVPRWWP